MRIISLNANGIRAAVNKGLATWWEASDSDILCIQESRLQDKDWLQAAFPAHWVECFPAEKKGYAGTAVVAKIPPNQVKMGMGHPSSDAEGRVMTLTYPGLVLVNAYFPSGASSPSRHLAKLDFLSAMTRHLQDLLKQHARVMLVGDINICHKDIDIHHPQRMRGKPGCTNVEREFLSALHEAGWRDAFRLFEPGKGQYTWWSAMARSKPKNLGWRIDQFWISSAMVRETKHCKHWTDQNFSDHCPIELTWENSMKFL